MPSMCELQGQACVPNIHQNTLIIRAVLKWNRLPLGGQYHRGTAALGEGRPGCLKPFQLNVWFVQEVKPK